MCFLSLPNARGPELFSIMINVNCAERLSRIYVVIFSRRRSLIIYYGTGSSSFQTSVMDKKKNARARALALTCAPYV